MTQHVLVDPGVHGRPVEEIMDRTNSLPDPRLMGDGEVTGGVHTEKSSYERIRVKQLEN